MEERLIARDVCVHFAGVKALDGVDLLLHPGEIVGLIGPNGAGKTTMVNVLSGFQRPTSGTVTLRESEIGHWPPHRIARAGLTRTFQNVRVFPELTILDNLVIGSLGVVKSRREAQSLAWTLLERMGLSSRAHDQAVALSHGEARWVGLMRAMAARPQFLLVDEPAAGLNDAEADELVTLLASVRRELGIALLVIEHNMRLIMNLCDRIQVLDHGKTIATGAPGEIQTDKRVLEAYLGTAA
jgi:ABC-type branched-subunit amino acid transport system ATPase component